MGRGVHIQSSIHRAAFSDDLVALVPRENVTFGKRVVEAEETSEGVGFRFENGGEAEASAAVVCDGVRSKIRHFVLGREDHAAHPIFTNKYAYRGLIPIEKAVGLLGDDLARNAVKGRDDKVAFRIKRDGKWEDQVGCCLWTERAWYATTKTGAKASRISSP